MTVSELITELQRWPGHVPVRVLMSEVVLPTGRDWDAVTVDHSVVATAVEYRGSSVEIIG